MNNAVFSFKINNNKSALTGKIHHPDPEMEALKGDRDECEKDRDACNSSIRMCEPAMKTTFHISVSTLGPNFIPSPNTRKYKTGFPRITKLPVCTTEYCPDGQKNKTTYAVFTLM